MVMKKQPAHAVRSFSAPALSCCTRRTTPPAHPIVHPREREPRDQTVTQKHALLRGAVTNPTRRTIATPQSIAAASPHPEPSPTVASYVTSLPAVTGESDYCVDTDTQLVPILTPALAGRRRRRRWLATTSMCFGRPRIWPGTRRNNTHGNDVVSSLAM